MNNTEIQREVASIFNELADMLETGRAGERCPVILTTGGSELGIDEMVRGAEMAAADGVDVILVGPEVKTTLRTVVVKDEKEAHHKMEELLESGEAKAAVTMHYSFPIGVATVGRVITPARGRPMFVATTTGTSSTNRVDGMVKNAIYGIAAAKACGIAEPTVGILNLDGARQVERALKDLAAKGYKINFATSVRADGGSVMRGNDLLVGAADVMVTDSLTGNVIMKVFSAFTSGGDYETVGYGYGPGVGPDFSKIVCILSRASGAPVVANALKLARQVATGGLVGVTASEIESAKRAGFTGFGVQGAQGAGPAAPCPKVEALKDEIAREVASARTQQPAAGDSGPAALPVPKVVTEEIPGIDILELEDACALLMKKGIFARTGMGCTGPIILVAPEDKPTALQALKEGGYIQ